MLFSKLFESKDQLDISILAADKVIKTESDIEDLLNTEVQIEHKTDGTKLTVVHVADKGDLGDWIIAYKNQILYDAEFEYQDSEEIAKKSVGASQYKLVFDHFKKLGKTGLPLNFEFAIEFLQRKPTLSSNYTNPHKMVLIGYSKCKYTAEFGILKTNSKTMLTEYRDEYAEILQIDTPNKLFKGYMKDFKDGIINDNLMKVYTKNEAQFQTDDPFALWKAITDTILEVESKYGGKEEGVVIKYGNKLIKVQQSYQLDQDARRKIKAKYMENDPALEGEYRKNVAIIAKDLASKCCTGTYEMRLNKLSELLQTTDFKITHSKKNDVQIQDDIHLKAKTLIRKALEGNNGCLVLGKFRVLTTGHCNVINTALKDYDKVLVCLVSGKATKDTLELRRRMLKQTFGNKITIVDTSTGLLTRVFEKSPFNINTVFCGTDRYKEYLGQLQYAAGMTVREYPRDANAISATKVINNINDVDFFNANTPKEIHNMYDEIRTAYTVLEGLEMKSRFTDYLFESKSKKLFEDVSKSKKLFEDGEGVACNASGVGGSAECGIGTSTADIAPVTMPLGTVLRHTKKDDPLLDELEESLEFSLRENGKEVLVPRELKEQILDVYRERLGYRITEECLTTDSLESVVSECLKDHFSFDCFKCFKSVIQFRNANGTKTFKIFQVVPGIFGAV